MPVETELADGPEAEVSGIGPFDIARVSWPGVEVESLACGEDLYGIQSRIHHDADAGLSLWKLAACSTAAAGEVIVTGRDARGRERVQVVDVAPYGPGRADCLVRLRLMAEDSDWGTDVSPVLELLAVRDGVPPESLPPTVMQMTLQVQRVNQPPVRRPVHVLDPDVHATIVQMRQRIEKVVGDHERRHDGSAPLEPLPREEVRFDLLGEEAGLSHVTEAGLDVLLRHQSVVREEAQQALDRLHAGRPDHRMRGQSLEIWRRAFSGLVALRMTHAEVLDAGLGPSTTQILLATWRLAEGDVLRVLDVPPDVALVVELPDGTRRWWDRAAVRIEDGLPTWSSEFDALAVKTMADMKESGQPPRRLIGFAPQERDSRGGTVPAADATIVLPNEWMVDGDEHPLGAALSDVEALRAALSARSPLSPSDAEALLERMEALAAEPELNDLLSSLAMDEDAWSVALDGMERLGLISPGGQGSLREPAARPADLRARALLLALGTDPDVSGSWLAALDARDAQKARRVAVSLAGSDPGSEGGAA